MRYETALKTGRFVRIAHGSREDATGAKVLLHQAQPEALEHQP